MNQGMIELMNRIRKERIEIAAKPENIRVQ